MCALGLLKGPDKKNWTCYQKIFAKGEAILYCMDRYSKNELVTQYSCCLHLPVLKEVGRDGGQKEGEHPELRTRR